MPTSTTQNPTPFVNWVTKNRLNVAYLLLATGMILLILTVYIAAIFTQRRASIATTPTASEQKPLTEEALAKKSEEDAAKATYSGDHLPLAVWIGLLSVVAFSGALWQLSRLVAVPDNEPFFTRLWILALGGVSGLTTTLFGIVMLFRWQDSFGKWINESDTEEARFVLLGLVTLLIGLVLMFLASLPARAEERNNATIRRIIYGYNATQTGMLLVVILVVANIASQLLLPNRLDTTAASFYTLREPSKQLLAELKQPVNIYLMIPEDAQIPYQPNPREPRQELYSGLYDDTLTLLRNCEEASKFCKVIAYSPAINARQIREIWKKTGMEEKQGFEPKEGLLIAQENNQTQSVFIPWQDLVDFQTDPGTGRRRIVYQGEARLMTELAVLSEGTESRVIYFTQGSGELNISDGGQKEGEEKDSAFQLKQYLTERKFEVRPLNFGIGASPIIQDAAVVVVAGPKRTLPAEAQKTLREYLLPSDPNTRKGKLIAFLPPFRDPEGKVGLTGLEGLLGELGIQTEQSRLFSQPISTRGQLSPRSDLIIAYPTSLFTQDLHPLGSLLAGKQFVFQDVRPVSGTSGPQGVKGTNLLMTFPDFYVWHETDYESFDPLTRNNEFSSDPQLKARKRLMRGASIAAISSSGQGKDEKPRAIVIGSASFLSDAGVPIGPGKMIAFSFFSGGVEWLREKPQNIGIEPRTSREFYLDSQPDFNRMFTVPVLLVLFGITGLGFGVWLSRRK